MKYFLGVLGTLLLVIFVIVLIFRGGDPDTVPADQVRKLADYATESGTVANFTASGPINAKENHTIVQITVTDAARKIEIINGYDGTVTSVANYPNTTAAFTAFLAGLEQVGFTKDRDSRLTFASVCPTGKRYSYQLSNGEEKVVDTWSATCEKGTYAGKTTPTQRLFEAQIPNYQDVVNDVRFSL